MIPFIRRLVHFLRVVAPQRPRINRDRRWGLEVARRHSWPLWVEQHLQTLRPLCHIDHHHRHSVIWLIALPSGKLRVIRESLGWPRRYLHITRRVQNLHRQLLVPDLQRSGCTALVDGHRCVRVHPPHDRLRRGDIVLQEYLLPAIDVPHASLYRRPTMNDVSEL